jgi:hypothetical protein
MYPSQHLPAHAPCRAHRSTSLMSYIAGRGSRVERKAGCSIGVTIESGRVGQPFWPASGVYFNVHLFYGRQLAGVIVTLFSCRRAACFTCAGASTSRLFGRPLRRDGRDPVWVAWAAGCACYRSKRAAACAALAWFVRPDAVFCRLRCTSALLVLLCCMPCLLLVQDCMHLLKLHQLSVLYPCGSVAVKSASCARRVHGCLTPMIARSLVAGRRRKNSCSRFSLNKWRCLTLTS